MIDGADTGDVALPDDAGADGVELPVGEYDAMFTIELPCSAGRDTGGCRSPGPIDEISAGRPAWAIIGRPAQPV